MGNLLDRQSIPINHRQHRPLLAREVAERSSHLGHFIADLARQRLRRRRIRRRHFIGHVFDQLSPSHDFAERIGTLVRNDPQQPAREAGRIVEPADSFRRGDPSFLRRIGRQVVPFGDAKACRNTRGCQRFTSSANARSSPPCASSTSSSSSTVSRDGSMSAKSRPRKISRPPPRRGSRKRETQLNSQDSPLAA